MAVYRGRSTSTLEAQVENPRTLILAAALAYGAIGTLYLGLFGFVVSVAWTGSLDRLVADLRGGSGEVGATFALLAVGHAALAVLAFIYLRAGRSLRSGTVAAAVLLALWNFGGAARFLAGRLDVGASPEAMPTLLLFKVSLIVVYSACAYSLWRAGTASNYRLERP
jgi:hypothetical protein